MEDLKVVARVQKNGLRITTVHAGNGDELFRMTDHTTLGTELAEGLVTMINAYKDLATEKMRDERGDDD